MLNVNETNAEQDPPSRACSGVVMWRRPARNGDPGTSASVALVFHGLSRGCSADSFCKYVQHALSCEVEQTPRWQTHARW